MKTIVTTKSGAQVNTQKLKDESRYLLDEINMLKSHMLELQATKLKSHGVEVFYGGTFRTQSGVGLIHTLTVPGNKIQNVSLATMCVPGASNPKIVRASCAKDAVIVEFDVDPGNDTLVNVHVTSANVGNEIRTEL